MGTKTTNPALRAAATGLGNVSCWAASDNQETTAHHIELQEKFISRRAQVRPDHARLIAALAFGGAA